MSGYAATLDAEEAISQSIQNNDVSFEQLEDESQGVINEMIANLSSRGKGNYLCPLGKKCQKNGVEPNGEPKMFFRNSAFRYVAFPASPNPNSSNYE